MSAKVKVTNTTNSKHPMLKQFNLDDQSLSIGGSLVDPGKSVEMPTEDWSLLKHHFSRLIKLGAVKVEEIAEAKEAAPALVSLKEEKKKSSETKGE